MGAITSAVIAVVGVLLGWITIEIACKPCLEKGREAIDRTLNPDYDPDDEEDTAIRAPLNPPAVSDHSSAPAAASSIAVKAGKKNSESGENPLLLYIYDKGVNIEVYPRHLTKETLKCEMK
ncbi:unnamed protein product [Sphenostylis stenocarpa]|uniref:Uncharacterized protein n=1 Tax=Sphenostylis stenocarpa TaxID=92480 RepID=A0AA86VNV5_9FABA|nr:unnamed protein product [Sphenostylis stenocarpa]